MTSNRNLITTESRGPQVSIHFDDSSVIQGLPDAALTRVEVWHGEYINSLTVSIPVILTTDWN